VPTVITGKDCEVTFGPGLPAVIIGERINPTGRKKLASQLTSANLDIVEKEAVSQKAAGADILDVNVGATNVKEEILLPLAVKKILEATGLPLCIDSANEKAIKAALTVYPHKPLINSVTGEEKSLDSILPLARDYNTAIIGLTVDDNGIPSETSKRIKIANKIVARAEALGIPREDVVIDCLAMASSADPASALVTLEVIRIVTKDLQLSTTIGVSNVSFGMPERQTLTNSFLAMCIEAGLSAAIVDPTNSSLMYTLLSSTFLTGKDKYADRFLTYYRQNHLLASLL